MTGATDPDAATLPPVAPQVVAEIVGALSERLAKRLDSATAKLLARPRSWSAERAELRIAVDEDAELVLRAECGSVASAEDVRCSCLLAPACLHRAAAVSAAPLAEATAPAADPAAEAEAAPAPAESGEDLLTPRERAAARAVWSAGAAVLAAGTGGSGAVLQAELLRAGHAAVLAGLHRAASAAVRVVALVRAARSGDASFRLADLAAALRELLLVAHGLGSDPAADPPSGLRGAARQSYAAAGSLRLYGLFTEPILTDTHAGIVTTLVDRDGTLHSVADVLPHDGKPDPAAARAVAAQAVRLGDAVLSHTQLSGGGLNLSGATRSATGRLGAGKGVRAVAASGAAWTETPPAALWAQSLREQLDRALAAWSSPRTERAVGADLLFLDLTLLGPVDGRLLALADGAAAPVVLIPGHADPGLAYARNLAALAAHPGLRLRAVCRLAATDRPAVQLLAAEIDGRRFNAGLAPVPPLPSAPDPLPDASPVPAVPLTGDPPIHLLLRRTERALVSGRRALHHDSAAPDDSVRLRRAALPTAAALLDELHRAARDTPRDAFGRSHPEDPSRFARAWLGATAYLSAFAAARCTDLWLHGGETGPA